jgi:serine/threonine protein kinase
LGNLPGISSSGLGGIGLSGGDITVLEKLGRGASSVVYKALWHGAPVALKVQSMNARHSYIGGLPKEICVAESLRHPNVVQQYGFELLRYSRPTGASPSTISSRTVVESTLARNKRSGSWSSGSQQKPNFDAQQQQADADRIESPPRAKAATASLEDDIAEAVETLPKGARQHREPQAEEEIRMKLFIVMELCNEGSLWDALRKNLLEGQVASRGLPSPPAAGTALTLALDIAMGMTYIHARFVVHGDLKAANVLLVQRDSSDATADCTCMAKVADFGLAMQIDQTNTTTNGVFAGTVTHMAPEVLRHGRQSRAADVFAFGILLYELFSASRPYIGKSASDIADAVLNMGARPVMPAGTPRKVIELSAECTRAAPAERPSMREVRDNIAKLVQEHAIEPVSSSKLHRRRRARHSIMLGQVREEPEDSGRLSAEDLSTKLANRAEDNVSDGIKMQFVMTPSARDLCIDLEDDAMFFDEEFRGNSEESEEDDDEENVELGTIVFEMRVAGDTHEDESHEEDYRDG